MPPRPDVSEERRNQILDVAEDVFAKRGFTDARMDDIVSASGLSKGAIYWYFRKKDELISGLLERVFKRNFDAVSRLAEAPNRSVLERFASVLDRVGADYRQLEKLAPVALDFYALALRNRATRSFITKMYARYGVILKKLLEEGVASGELRVDLDVKNAIATFIALVEGMGLVWALDRKTIDWNRTPAVAAELLIEGLRA